MGTLIKSGSDGKSHLPARIKAKTVEKKENMNHTIVSTLHAV
jgi:hypothetical protein